MKPVPLSRPGYDAAAPISSPSSEGVDLYLDNLNIPLPEEGEIRFRYSRRNMNVNVTKDDARRSYTLCLKTITDICDCKDKDGEDKDEEYNDEEKAPDAEEVLEELFEELTDKDYTDESEDDNPDKY